MASITGSGPPFSVLERSFHLLHAICIIMKISRRSVPGEWRLRPWRMQIFDWKIILARQRSFSLSLAIFRWTARQGNVLHPPERVWTKLLPRHRSVSEANLCCTSSSNSQPWRETERCSVESTDWSGLAKEFLFPSVTTSYKQHFSVHIPAQTVRL